jgi:hypothetical protein
VKYFAAHFRVDHYTSHMRVAHPERFAEYCRLAGDAKEFFSMSVPFVNTLNAYCEVGPFCFTIDAATVDDLIVGMLYGEDENERGRSSGIPTFFEKGCHGKVYNVTVRKAKQLVLCRRIVAAGVSLHVTSRIMRNVADVTGVSQVSLGISDLEVADYIRSTVAFVLQTIYDVIRSCWSFYIAFDVATAHTTSYFDAVFGPTSPARYRISMSSRSRCLNVIPESTCFGILNALLMC